MFFCEKLIKFCILKFFITAIATEGKVGTLISRPDVGAEKALTPAELRRLSAGNPQSLIQNQSPVIYRPLVTPSTFVPYTGIFERVALSNHTSRHDITTIREETGSENGDALATKRLQNWYERSPRKKSAATIPTFDQKSVITTLTPRRRSFCPGILGGAKSSSLANLVLCKQSMSVEEQEEEELVAPLPQQNHIRPTSVVPSSKSHESLSAILKSGESTPLKLLSPASAQPGLGKNVATVKVTGFL